MTGLPRYIRDLDAFLLSDNAPEDCMLVTELDGFLAGVITCPDLVMPSEWLPKIWGDGEPVFDDQQQAEKITSAMMRLYNDIIHLLDQHKYTPIFDVDPRNGDILWEMWAEGFYKAMQLRPQVCLALPERGKALKAVSIMTRLIEHATLAPQDIDPQETDKELLQLAPDLIPDLVQDLHDDRKSGFGQIPEAANSNFSKTGKNDPFPCGSGKKYKKCCLK